MIKKIYYWAPCLNKVGTYYSTINSAISVSKFSKGLYKPIIIDVCGEWNESEELIKNNNIEKVKFYKKNYFKYLPKNGFLKSRFSYFVISLLSIFPLLKLMRKNYDQILIVHLVTFLPLVLKIFFSLRIKTILRISGYPKLNFFRKKLWQYSNEKLIFITCPTKDLITQIKEFNIFAEDKILHLPDPILKINNFLPKNNQIIIPKYDKIILSVGRLTKQKNFLYLVKEFEKFSKFKKDYCLIILGEGEERNILEKYILKKNISDRVFLKGYVTNVFEYMKLSKLFILSSLWEDPGFVLIEAGFKNLFVISSDCPNGPKELLDNGKGGILFESNKENAIFKALLQFEKLKKNEIMERKIFLKKNIMKYSVFRHYLSLNKILHNS